MNNNDVLHQILGTVQSMEQRLQQVETNMVTRDEVQHLIKEETKSLATKEMLEDVATKDMLEGLATKESQKALATTDQVGGLEKQVDSLQTTVTRMESRQELIYNQTAQLSEFRTEVTTELSDVKDRISFQTHKLSEAELELYKLKNSR
ncbi:hypothetical protein [Salibacterium lacus]|uniref:DUF1640 domain-containing protein n=1 Tax=Salibacterium lacus TaxID=1898109 RepID=A0ABW5T464_9BACI